jgi:hypothetical protein
VESVTRRTRWLLQVILRDPLVLRKVNRKMVFKTATEVVNKKWWNSLTDNLRASRTAMGFLPQIRSSSTISWDRLNLQEGLPKLSSHRQVLLPIQRLLCSQGAIVRELRIIRMITRTNSRFFKIIHKWLTFLKLIDPTVFKGQVKKSSATPVNYPHRQQVNRARARSSCRSRISSSPEGENLQAELLLRTR